MALSKDWQGDGAPRLGPGALNLAALLFFGFATALMLFPLAIQAADHLTDLGDPAEYAWVLAWDAHQLLIQPLSLYDANYFYPYSNSLAYSESQIASALIGLPVFLFSGNSILSYNLVFLLSFALSGFCAYLLAYDVTRHRVGAILAGFAFAFWPYRTQHLSHINLQTLQYLPLVLLSFRRAFISHRWTMSALFGISFTAQALSSWYMALMTGLGVGLYALYQLGAHRDRITRSRLVGLAGASFVSLVVILAVGMPYFQVSQELQFGRTLSENEQLSAQPASFISVSDTNRLYHNVLPDAVGEALFPGALVLALSVLGATARRGVVDRGFWLLLAVFFAIISLGPTLHFAANLPPLTLPYRWLYDYFPGFQGTRAPARFFALGMLGLVVLAAGGTNRLVSHLDRKRWLVGAVALLLMGLEYDIAPLQTAYIQSGSQAPPLYQWLAQQPEGNVLELPVQVGDIEPITRAMYFSTYHWHATPLGYASFVPPTQADLLNTINNSLNPPSARLVNVLREFRVRYLVFHTNAYTPTQWQSLREGLSQVQALQPAFADGGDVVYQVPGPAPPHPLAFSYLVSSYAQAQARSRAYVLVVQPRHYPVVNDDLQSHEVTVQWTDNGTPVGSQKFEVRLPQVLRDRAEGVGVDLITPPRPGTFQLNWYLDSKPLAPIDQISRVVVDDRAPSDDSQVPIELISYTLEPRQATAGGELILTLFWRRLQEVGRDYDVVVSLHDQSGKEWAKIKRQPVLWTYPPRLWRDGELVADAYAVTVPEQAAPGNYHLTIALTLSNSEQAERFRLPTGSDGSQFTTEPFQVIAH